MARELKFAEHLYNSLPEVYRTEDSTQEVNYTLKRYLETLGEGGLDVISQETKDLVNLMDVEKIPTKHLPVYAKMFGIEYRNDVPEEFQRKYLSNAVNILRRRGTKSVIRYVASELTGFETDITEMHYRGFRTWGTNTHEEMGGNFELPKTFNGVNNQLGFYYFGGDKIRNGVLGITLKTGLDAVESTLQEQLLEKYLVNLMPVYAKLIFFVTTSWGEDIGTVSNVTEIMDKIIYGDTETYTRGSIAETLYDIINIGGDSETTDLVKNITEYDSFILSADDDEVNTTTTEEGEDLSVLYTDQEEYLVDAVEEILMDNQTHTDTEINTSNIAEVETLIVSCIVEDETKTSTIADDEADKYILSGLPDTETHVLGTVDEVDIYTVRLKVDLDSYTIAIIENNITDIKRDTEGTIIP